MRRISLLATAAACLSLSACGGGGGTNSTPTPTPSPSPTPSPTPTPAQTNSSLINLQQSESFTNDAAHGTAKYPKSGADGTASASAETLSVSYDAAKQSYTITANSLSREFRQTDIDAATSNSQITVYKRTNGGTVDSLTLTKPGLSGRFTYQYVGGGVWQRTTETSNMISGTVDAFAYGVETADAAVPRTGIASFDVDLLGTLAFRDIALGLNGSGRLDVDFQSGDLTSRISAHGINPLTGQVTYDTAFEGTAKISSAANQFAGSFTMDGMTGSWNGRFYGPAAQEVGASFAASDSSTHAATGILIGRNADNSASQSLSQLKTKTQLEGYEAYSSAVLLNTTFYDPTDQSYAFGSSGIFQATDKVASESDAQFTTYERTVSGYTIKYKAYNFGATVQGISLTYLSFAFSVDPSSNSVITPSVYGIKTLGDNIPRIGQAHYSGIVYGGGTIQASNFRDLNGTAQFDFNFGSSSFTGSLSLVATDRFGSTTDFGTSTFANGAINHNFSTNQFTADLVPPAGRPGSGTLTGSFYGPTANEIGAGFRADLASPGIPTVDSHLWGIIVGKKQ